MRRLLAQFLLLCSAVFLCACTARVTDLSGTWAFRLDPDGAETVDSPFDRAIELPGTTDLAGVGFSPERMDQTARLTRRHAYVGRAWYRREVHVPRAWADRNLALYLERTKATSLYLDGTLVGTCNSLSTPQIYGLGRLTPGPHTLVLCVDNGGGVPQEVIRSSHMYSDDTQTNWNGVIGRMVFGPEEELAGQASVTEMPRLEVVGGRFQAEGHPVFLRGRHDACVFPATGHTPMDKASWLQYFERCRDYGLNHVRFHSWCPPEAAFAAADECGIYLQPELPFWGTLEGEELIGFLKEEGLRILKTYGHHPSFALFSLGNELWGEPSVMQEMVNTFRAEAPHILYTNGTNAFLGYRGYVEGMDFMVTARTIGEAYGQYDTHVRSSFAFCDALDGGIMNHFYPGTYRNYSQALKGVPVPVVSHETGQFQSYPDFREIDKYEGTPFIPCNLMEFSRRLELAGMGTQAEDFHRASVRWAAQLYKADVEMCLRTPDLGGFQLLDIQDYPGQGSAYVGMTDAFMDDKDSLVSSGWKSWCGEVVPLAEFDKYCWSSDETFRARLLLANYGTERITGIDYCLFLGEELPPTPISVPEGEGLLELGDIEADLSSVSEPTRGQLYINVYVDDSCIPQYRNHWPIWIYPANSLPDKSGITVTRRLDPAARGVLDSGGKVLLIPSDTTGTVSGLFQTDYWNYRMFKEICESMGKTVSPGTLGILTDAEHPLFREFPTEGYTSWQWFPVLKASRPMILDGMNEYQPLVQVIDNVERNHRLGLLFEFKVGKGKLMVCCANLESTLNYPEGRQFYKAVLDYMRSEDFQPKAELPDHPIKTKLLPLWKTQ